MQTSVIRQRVADFLKQHAPFDILSEADLLELAGSGKVKFHQSEEYVVRQNGPKPPFIWVIQQGRVELIDEGTSGERLCDVIGEGDIVGLDQFDGDGSCRYSARTANDVILYGVAAAVFESLIDRYPDVKRFLAAHFSISSSQGFKRTSWLEAAAPPSEFLVARSNGGDASVSFTTRSAIQEMLRLRSEEILITPAGPVLTASDLALFCNHNPARMIAILRGAKSLAEIKPLLPQCERMIREALAEPGDAGDCCRIAAEVQCAIAEACIRMAEDTVKQRGIAASSIPCCWVLFGASGRGDSAFPGLPTIAAVYDDSGETTVRDTIYYAAVVGETANQFYACGLIGPGDHWPEGVQPSMPLSEWMKFFEETIRNPIAYDLYARREFFDLSPLAGEERILRQLQGHIQAELEVYQAAVALLANDTLANLPPMTFFQGLVLDLEGGQHEGFDIAETVIAPLSNAARVFALAKRNLARANTLERFEQAALDYPESAALLREAAEAFRIGLYYQAFSDGARINPAKLAKFDQTLLKTAFASIQRFLEFTVSTMVPDL